MQTAPRNTGPWSERIRTAELSGRARHPVALEPDAPTRAAIVEALGIRRLRKLRLQGELIPEGREDWRLEAMLGATAEQDCVITLAPVTTRIDEPVTRRWVTEMPELPEGEEVEMPQDESLEPLTSTIDLGQVMVEALALALPEWPRAEGAELEQAQFAGPGVAPLRDEDVKPFAGLADLRERMNRKE